MIKKYKDKIKASGAMAEELKAIALDAVAKRGRFTLALTGGSSPLILHEILRSPAYWEALPWKDTWVYWGDERMVPFNDDLNNAKMGFETLLNHVPINMEKVFRMNSELKPEAAAEEYTKILKNHFEDKEPGFDLILLGMGADGHTASIFPGAETVHEKEKWVTTGYNEDQGTERLTLTAPFINKAHNIFIAVFGEDKAKTLKNVLEGDFNPDAMPVQLVKPQNGKLYWFIDDKAGALLK